MKGLNQAVNGVPKIVGPPLGASLLVLLLAYGAMFVDVSTPVLTTAPSDLEDVLVPKSSQASGGEAEVFWSELPIGLR